MLVLPDNIPVNPQPDIHMSHARWSIMITDSLRSSIKTIVGADNAWTDETDLHTYSYDAAVVDPVQPGLIIRPTSSEAARQSRSSMQR
jgi:hypothetical protein